MESLLCLVTANHMCDLVSTYCVQHSLLVCVCVCVWLSMPVVDSTYQGRVT